jgi:hypothetical protein
MRSNTRTFTQLTVMLLAVAAALAGSPAAASAATAGSDFRAEAAAAGLSEAQAGSLQQRVDKLLAGQPGGRQVSATKIEYDGLTVTVDPYYSAAAGADYTARRLNCDYGYLCMTVRGTNFRFYECRTWYLSDWTGTGPYINNQTVGTVASFYGQNGELLWTSTAYDEGTANWDPVWSLRPC